MDLNSLVSELTNLVVDRLKQAELEGGRSTAELLVNLLANEKIQALHVVFIAVVVIVFAPGASAAVSVSDCVAPHVLRRIAWNAGGVPHVALGYGIQRGCGMG